MRWTLALVMLTAFVPVACRDGASSERVPTIASTQPTAATGDETNSGQLLARFLSQPIRGDRPFRTVAAFLDWLEHRPGIASATAETTPGSSSGEARITVTLRAEDGRMATAACRYGPSTRFATTGVFWDDCVEVVALWSALVPPTFATMAEALPFLGPGPVFLPLPPPDGFGVVRVTLPATPEQARLNPFVFSVVFARPGGAEVTLTQQPAGLNTAIFPDYQACLQSRWPSPALHRVATAVICTLPRNIW